MHGLSTRRAHKLQRAVPCNAMEPGNRMVGAPHGAEPTNVDVARNLEAGTLPQD